MEDQERGLELAITEKPVPRSGIRLFREKGEKR
jgi:hypothetical protein